MNDGATFEPVRRMVAACAAGLHAAERVKLWAEYADARFDGCMSPDVAAAVMRVIVAGIDGTLAEAWGIVRENLTADEIEDVLDWLRYRDCLARRENNVAVAEDRAEVLQHLLVVLTVLVNAGATVSTTGRCHRRHPRRSAPCRVAAQPAVLTGPPAVAPVLTSSGAAAG